MSNLEHLIQKYTLTPLETIKPFLTHPSWSLPIDICIDSDKDTAEQHHDAIFHAHTSDNISFIYTDGSGLEGRTSVAAFSWTSKIATTKFLGPNTMSTVFSGELEGINIALNQIPRDADSIKTYYIFSDSQAAIKAIRKPKRQSAQFIIKEIINQIGEIDKQTFKLKIVIQWVPVHCRILGNEAADTAAKQAILKADHTLAVQWPILKAAKAMELATTIKSEWDMRWIKYKRLKERHGEIKIIRGLQLYSGITKRQHIAWLVRLRTGHCGLNKYLARFRKIESPICKCGWGHETVAHYLLVCSKYEEEREILRSRAGEDGMKVEKLLGTKGLLKHTLEFIQATMRFSF